MILISKDSINGPGWLVSKTSRQNVHEVWSLDNKCKRCQWQRKVSLPSERSFNYFKMAVSSQMATSELYCWEGDWGLPSVDTECLIVLVRYILWCNSRKITIARSHSLAAFIFSCKLMSMLMALAWTSHPSLTWLSISCLAICNKHFTVTNGKCIYMIVNVIWAATM